jgi:hypothetical protein
MNKAVYRIHKPQQLLYVVNIKNVTERMNGILILIV